ncbi:MAG: rhodanese-like domain-containing protein [Planctomycetota bacterium]
MADLSLALSSVALAASVVALLRSRSSAAPPEDTTREVRRITGNLESELRAELDLTRRMLAEVARGSGITPEAIMEGQLWRDVDVAEALPMATDPSVTLVDVRTPAETRAGYIPGAKLIPMDELDERKDEIPRNGRVLIYCAMGGRSAAACEGLSREGWSGLMNLTGGIGAWNGPLERR